MGLLYPECKSCVAKPFCRKLLGEISPDPTKDWCAESNRLIKALQAAMIPYDYMESNFYNFTVDEENKEVFNKLKPIADNIVEKVSGGMNILLTGSGCGVGKTYNAIALLNHYIYKTCLTQFDYEKPTGLFVVYPKFIKAMRNFDDNEDVKELFEVMSMVSLLVIDDIGAGLMTDFTRELTYVLLNDRLNNRLSTIVTSNVSPSALKADDRLGARNVSRLTRNCLWLEINGAERRRSFLR